MSKGHYFCHHLGWPLVRRVNSKWRSYVVMPYAWNYFECSTCGKLALRRSASQIRCNECRILAGYHPLRIRTRRLKNCARCGASMVTHTDQQFCRRCRNRSPLKKQPSTAQKRNWFQRMRQDPVRWAAYLAKRKKQYLQMREDPERYARHCTMNKIRRNERFELSSEFRERERLDRRMAMRKHYFLKRLLTKPDELTELVLAQLQQPGESHESA